jgi:hypothetical protein
VEEESPLGQFEDATGGFAGWADSVGGVVKRIAAEPDSTGRIGRVTPVSNSAGFSTGKRGFSTETGKGVAKDAISNDETDGGFAARTADFSR